jgi:maleamate amidohydrolase
VRLAVSDLDVYKAQNFGNRLGFGRRPALLVVDFVNGFDDPAMLGGGNIHDAVLSTVPLLVDCRALGIPVVFTRIVYADDGRDVGVFAQKLPRLRELVEDTPASQIVPELAPREGEYVVRKRQPSAFAGTQLAAWLRWRRVDTLIVTGCTTSGCVRASVVDAMSIELRPIVPVECVGDRALGPHEANLFDMQQKYADVMRVDEVRAALAALDGGTRAPVTAG